MRTSRLPRPFRLVLVTLITLCAFASAARAATADDLPRYQLPVGRKLVYSGSGESKSLDAAGPAMVSTGTWQLTVVKENPDGSRRLIVRSGSTFGREGADRAPSERVQLGYADVFPDGRILPNATLGMSMDLAHVLPPLPADAKQLADGWMRDETERLQLTTYQPRKSDSPQAPFTFTAEVSGAMNTLYASTRKTTFEFDRAKGIITSSTGESSQNYGFRGKGSDSMKLESDETIAPDQAAALAADYQRLFDVQKQYGEKLDAVNHSKDADADIAQAKALLEQAAADAKTDDVKKELATMLDRHDRSAKHARESANELKALLDKPAADWQTTDIEGNPVRLADFRGKVVVMDFWYRGCGWCMYAMPQVKQLANVYKDKPVAVLGMNTDADEKDARMVIEVLELKHPTIKAAGIPEKYGVQGFPTLVILDQQGIVRDVHVGYSPDLRETVAKKIDELLAAPATAPSTAPAATLPTAAAPSTGG